MKAIKIAILFVFASLITGCIDVDINVKVKSDGSGIIEEKIIIGNKFIDVMKEMASQMGGSTEDLENIGGIDEVKLKAEAADFGEGVRFVRAEEINNSGGKGYLAIYEFDDITKIRIDEDPMSKMPDETQMMAPQGEDSGEDDVSFSFTKGDVSTLQITLREKDEDFDMDTESDEDEGSDEISGDDKKVLEILKDMKIAITLEIDGTIVEENASFIDGNKITILQMDFGKLIENKDELNKFLKTKPESFEEMKEIMENIDGIKIETNKQLTVKFK